MNEIIETMASLGDRLALAVSDYGCSFDPPGFRAEPKGEQGACFRCAFNEASRNNAMTYVEGYGIVHGVPLHHAWCVDPSGFVFDHVWEPKGIEGYYGVPLKTGVVASVTLAKGTWGVFTGRSIIHEMDLKEVVRWGPWLER